MPDAVYVAVPLKTWQAVVSQMSEVAMEGAACFVAIAYVRVATAWACRAAGCHDAGLSWGTTPRR